MASQKIEEKVGKRRIVKKGPLEVCQPYCRVHWELPLKDDDHLILATPRRDSIQRKVEVNWPVRRDSIVT